jgi:hypothetical protein
MVFIRRRPLLRAAVVGGGAYLAGRQRGARHADSQHLDAGLGQRVSGREQAAAPSMADQLDRLTDLHSQGVLSDDELAAAKAKLLGA